LGQSSHIEHGVLIPVFDQRGELPLLPFGNPIGFMPALRGEIYIEYLLHSTLFSSIPVQLGSGGEIPSN